MQRKEFIKRLGLGSLIVPFVAACGNESSDPTPTSESCDVSPSETAGPFPTKSPSSLVMEDITSDRTGIEMVMNITVQNKNTSCAAASGVVVDVWHCDKDGYYSEYGGTGMQSVNFQSVHFLRGRQTTNADGLVSFKTIFPGWYSGRAPHIHVHLYDSSGNSLLVTQIAFPADVCNTVYTTATQYYTKGTQDTSNSTDNIFSDSLSSQLATVEGSVADGFVLTHNIVVSM
jgi:protocatechuate 3,4-dioxygenase beta subunit